MIDSQSLILIGGGGHCKSVIDVAECAGFHIEGILDIPENVGKQVCGYPVIGTDDLIGKLVSRYLFMVTVGQIKDPSLRIKLHEQVINSGGRLATIVSPTAHVSRFAELGEGSVVMHQAMVNAEAKVGRGCIINTFANIEHDVVIGDYCHISTGAMINGGCTIGNATFIGSQSVINNGIVIGSDIIVPSGCIVRKNISVQGIYKDGLKT